MQNPDFSSLTNRKPQPLASTRQGSPRAHQAPANYRVASSINSTLVNDPLNIGSEGKKKPVGRYGLLRERAGHQKPKSLLRAEGNVARYFSNVGPIHASKPTSRDASPKFGSHLSSSVPSQQRPSGLPILQPISSIQINGQHETINEMTETPNEATPRQPVDPEDMDGFEDGQVILENRVEANAQVYANYAANYPPQRESHIQMYVKNYE